MMKVTRLDMIIFLIGILGWVAYGEFAHGATSENLKHNVCVRHASMAAGLFDMITSNPDVILSAPDEAYKRKFEAVRKWVKEGKSRDDLRKDVYARCMGVSV